MTKTIEELETQLEKALTSISKLEAKNEEVIGKLKAETARADKAEEDAEAAADTAANAAGDELSKLQREYKKLEKALTEMTSERDTLAGDLRVTRVDSAISAAIASGNVRQEMVEAVEAIMHRKVQYEDGEATIDGKPIQDFAKSYFSKDGAHFVRASDSAGADSAGNSGVKASSHGFTKDNFGHNQYAMVYLDDPELANSIAEELGKPELRTDN